jgi:hypothetical protein
VHSRLTGKGFWWQGGAAVDEAPRQLDLAFGGSPVHLSLDCSMKRRLPLQARGLAGIVPLAHLPAAILSQRRRNVLSVGLL